MWQSYKTPTHKTKNHIKMDNKHSSDKFDTIIAKKSKKNMINTRSNKKSNESKTEVFQSTH